VSVRKREESQETSLLRGAGTNPLSIIRFSGYVVRGYVAPRENEKMKRRNIHQWRNWILDYICDDKYELIQKDSLAVSIIVAKDAMDAENQCRKIIDSVKAEGV
jgi:hypothetical protein